MAGTAGYFEYGFQKNWSVTYTNFIGVTKNTTIRSPALLPNPASEAGAKNDATTIYIDSINGNDANTGFTLALAVKTWDRAIIQHLANPLRTTIHVDTTHPTTRDFDLTGALGGIAVNFPETLLNIQSATGTITTLTLNGYYQTSGVLARQHWWQGFILKNTNPLLLPCVITSSGSADNKSLRMEWCTLYSPSMNWYHNLTISSCHFKWSSTWYPSIIYIVGWFPIGGKTFDNFFNICEVIG